MGEKNEGVVKTMKLYHIVPAFKTLGSGRVPNTNKIIKVFVEECVNHCNLQALKQIFKNYMIFSQGNAGFVVNTFELYLQKDRFEIPNNGICGSI